MRKIREVPRLKYECQLSNAKIARSCNISRESVRKYLLRANQAQLQWPLPAERDDQQLEQLLFPYECSPSNNASPDMQWVHQELKKNCC